MCNHAHNMQKHGFWNSPKSLSRNEINKDRRLSLNCSKSRTCTIFTMPVLFPLKNDNFSWCVSFFLEYTFLYSYPSVFVIRRGVPWPSGLVHWICVLLAESSECGLEPRPRSIAIAIAVLIFLSKTLYHNCFSPPRSKWVPVRAELVVVFD